MTDPVAAVWQLVAALSFLLMGVLIISTRRRGSSPPPGILTVCILCRDQECRLEYMVRRLLAILSEGAGGRRVCLVLLDVGSADESPRIAARLARTCPGLVSVRGGAAPGDELLRLLRARDGGPLLTLWVRSAADWEDVAQWVTTVAAGEVKRSGSDGKWMRDR